MNTTAVVAIVIVVLVLIAAFLVWRGRRTSTLKQRFGPEYDHAVEERGRAARAEADLMARQRRVERYQLKPLATQDRQVFINEWRGVQARFVEDPRDAVVRADDLVGRVMTARGYPGGDFDTRLEDLSVDHGRAVQDYRAAHDVVIAHGRGEASTEDMRQALIHLRTLFDELVEESAPRDLKAAS